MLGQNVSTVIECKHSVQMRKSKCKVQIEIRHKLKNAPHQTDFYDKNCLMGSIIKCPNVKSDNKSKFITDT